jgi:hypothetical protein
LRADLRDGFAGAGLIGGATEGVRFEITELARLARLPLKASAFAAHDGDMTAARAEHDRRDQQRGPAQVSMFKRGGSFGRHVSFLDR